MSVAVDITHEAVAPADGSVRGERTPLTDYETGQVREIAAWKARPPNPFGELFKRMTRPGTALVERVLPDRLVKVGIDRAYDLAHHAADGLAPPERALEDCDAEAIRVGSTASGIALAEGAITGAGGPITTLFDLPLLFALSIRTIVRIGRCYSFPLDQERDRKFVLGVLIAAASGSLAVRLDRLGQLRDVEDWFLQETQEEIITNEVAALLFQLEIFEEMPAVGAISGGLLNLAFLRRVEITSRRVFQERWLHARGKVDVIAPHQTHARALARGWSGTLVRAAHAGGYRAGYAAALPFWLVAAVVRPPARVPGLTAE